MQVTLPDAFGPQAGRTLDVEAPKHLCLPLDENGEGVDDPSDLLVCHQAEPARQS